MKHILDKPDVNFGRETYLDRRDAGQTGSREFCKSDPDLGNRRGDFLRSPVRGRSVGEGDAQVGQLAQERRHAGFLEIGIESMTWVYPF